MDLSVIERLHSRPCQVPNQVPSIVWVAARRSSGSSTSQLLTVDELSIDPKKTQQRWCWNMRWKSRSLASDKHSKYVLRRPLGAEGTVTNAPDNQNDGETILHPAFTTPGSAEGFHKIHLSGGCSHNFQITNFRNMNTTVKTRMQCRESNRKPQILSSHIVTCERSRPRSPSPEPQLIHIPMSDGDDQPPQTGRQRQRSRSRERSYPHAQVPQGPHVQPMIIQEPVSDPDEDPTVVNPSSSTGLLYYKVKNIQKINLERKQGRKW